MNSFAFSVPMPPSANNMFATFNGRRIISRDYKAWRAGVIPQVANDWRRSGSPKFDRHLSLTVHLGLNYKGDIDNRLKPILDMLGKAIPDFPDDRYIDRISIERVTGIDNARVLILQGAPLTTTGSTSACSSNSAEQVPDPQGKSRFPVDKSTFSFGDQSRSGA